MDVLIGAAAWLFLFIIAIGAASALFAHAPVVPSGQTFTCTAIAVWDGDGPIWCAEGPHVRLARIAARELDGTCRPYHPCPAASGIAARDYLVGLLGGARGTLRTGHIRVGPTQLTCRSTGWAKGDRTAARCTGRQGDLSTAMVTSRTALSW